MIETSICIYLFIGALFLVRGPVAENITREIDRARGTPLSNAYLEREQPAELKLFILRAVVSIGFVLLWPIFVWGVFKEHRDSKLALEIFREKSKGLWFSYMGGHGSVTCNDCGHSEDVTSFIHGSDSSTSGFQCQGCGKFSAIKSGGPGRANEYRESLECECGGNLMRDKVIFCPSCKSEKLSYRTLFIT